MRLVLAALAAVSLSLAAGPRLASAAEKAKPRVIEMTVTEDGYVPAEIKVKKGEPVTLSITRKAEKTCATEIVIKDYGINTPLPLGKTVAVTFTPKKEGKVKYACGMDMITGYLVVQ